MSDYVDVRHDGLYRKLGGIRALLQIVSTLRSEGTPVDLNGIWLRRAHLPFVVSAYNAANAQNKVVIDDDGAVRWAAAPKMQEEAIPQLSLEESLFTLAADTQAASLEAVRSLVAQEDGKGAVDEYLGIAGGGRYDPAHLTNANAALDRMLTQENPLGAHTLEEFVLKTDRFVQSYRLPAIDETVSRVFAVVKKSKGTQLSDALVERLNEMRKHVFRSAPVDISSYRRRIASINKEAFELFRSIGSSAVIVNAVKVCVWQYLMDMLDVVRQADGLLEKKAVLDEAWDVGLVALGAGTPKDVVTSANVTYCMALLCLEKYDLLKKKDYLREASHYFERSSENVSRIHSRQIVTDMNNRLGLLSRRLNQYEHS